MQARRGELVDVLDGEGLIAEAGGRSVGLITWVVERTVDASRADSSDATEGVAATVRAEIRALGVEEAARGAGVGGALLAAAEAALAGMGVSRAWLVTTNDNLAALALYQKAGWRLSALRAGAIDELRRTIKPSIGEVGQHGIPLRDELELEKQL